jgi:hypothetical protein
VVHLTESLKAAFRSWELYVGLGKLRTAALRLQADVIVHGTSEPLRASQVAFGGLH